MERTGHQNGVLEMEATKYCYGCQRKFKKIYRNKRQCRSCGDVVCKECLPNRIWLDGKWERTCMECVFRQQEKVQEKKDKKKQVDIKMESSQVRTYYEVVVIGILWCMIFSAVQCYDFRIWYQFSQLIAVSGCTWMVWFGYGKWTVWRKPKRGSQKWRDLLLYRVNVPPISPTMAS